MSATLTSDGSGTDASSSTTGFGGGVTLSYDAASGAYTVREAGGLTQTFTPGDLRSSDAAITAYQKNGGTVIDDLVLFNPGAGNSQLALSYVSYGAWQRLTENTATTVSAMQQYFVYGIQQAGDRPTTGTGSYQTIVDGIWTDTTGTYSLGGTSSLIANFGALTVSTSLNLEGTNVVTDAPRTLGFFNGSGTIAALGNGFSGTFSHLGADPDGNVYAGGFNGAFFGPAGAEVGYTFSLSSSTGAAVGAVVGKAQ